MRGTVKPHFFPTKTRRVRPPAPLTVDRQPATPEAIGLIQGIVPDSKQEWWVARGLDEMHARYKYQYPIDGGSRRGGYFIDFVIYTEPLWTMLELYANHWHTEELGADDRRRQVEIEDRMSEVARVPMTILWADDLIDQEHTRITLRKKLVLQ